MSKIFRGGLSEIWGVGGCLKFSGRGGSPPKYGQRSAGTHPTGMHSCFNFKLTRLKLTFIPRKKWGGMF